MGEIVAFVGAKGGVGTTLVTVMAAARSQHDGHQSFIVDLTGDVGVVLDTRDDVPGVHDLAAGRITGAELAAVVPPLSGGVRVLPQGRPGGGDYDWDRVWSELRERPGRFWVDADSGAGAAQRLRESEIPTVLVVSNCRAAAAAGRDIAVANQPAAAVVVRNTHRSFSASQAQRMVGVDDAVVIGWDPALNRWADAGILLDRPKCALDALRDIGINTAEAAPSREATLLG